MLLKLCFSLSKKIIFFSPILANNNLPLKIYCEKIVIAFHSSFFFFSPSFFILHTRHFFLFFFFLFFPPLFFSSTHVHVLFSFLSFFPPFFPCHSSKLQNIQSSPSSSLFFFLSTSSVGSWRCCWRRIVGERPIAGQRSIWVCVFGQTHIQVSLFSFVDCSEVNGSVLLGVLLIKSLPSKCISQIRLDRNKI